MYTSNLPKHHGEGDDILLLYSCLFLPSKQGLHLLPRQMLDATLRWRFQNFHDNQINNHILKYGSERFLHVAK